MKEFEWFEWFEWFGPSPIEPFNLGWGALPQEERALYLGPLAVLVGKAVFDEAFEVGWDTFKKNRQH